MLRIQPLLTDSTTLVEIHFTNAIKYDAVIDINTPDTIIDRIKEKYKNCKTTKYMSYCKNELTYLYNLTDDHQTVFSKFREKDVMSGNLYAVSYKFSKLPTHLFPCVSDIDMAIEYTLHEYKLSNRLSIIIRKDEYGQYAYIEYKHSDNVDIEQIESHLNNILQCI